MSKIIFFSFYLQAVLWLQFSRIFPHNNIFYNKFLDSRNKVPYMKNLHYFLLAFNYLQLFTYFSPNYLLPENRFQFFFVDIKNDEHLLHYPYLHSKNLILSPVKYGFS